MPRVSNFELLKKREQPVVSIRKTVHVNDLPKLIGESYGKLDDYVKGLGEFLSDVPFVAYHNLDMENMDVEMAFPVAGKLPDNDDIKFRVIPEEKVIFCMYRGPYSEISQTYDEMGSWLYGNGFKSKGVAYEHYYNGPDFPESEMITMVVMPVF